ncbi:hypothetical protein [Actinoplanes sp. N902-109]|uniref:hypothetical protein n=1 Tax=Actinoplanes sp. (strain N902-109) TaxID=649831 RepID=UPI0003294FFC|nr:hypothetical protein [Actinoplanes sp. N902-109]AGL15370.1 hypothetical protein L083_1860 [Actinoplanes sp. N902-109]
MAVAPTVPDVADAPAPARGKAARRIRPWWRDAAVAALCLGMAYWITSGIWSDPWRRAVSYNEGDHAFFEWVLAYGVQILRHGADPFWTTLMNAPGGVNLAANTSITVYAILFAPLTYLAGPSLTYVTILTLNLAGSSFAWYLFLRRFAVPHRLSALLGALFCGFAPGWIAHANGHLNWTAGWLAPVLLWWVIRLRTSPRWLLNGIVLGLLISVAFSIAPEMLFYIAMAAIVFVIAWGSSRATWPQIRRAAPRALAALGVSVVIAGALLAYPLHMHFAGPGSYQGTGFDQRKYVEDLAGYGVYPFRSIAGAFGLQRGDLASNQTEGASFFGVPLLLLVVAGTVLLWWRADRTRKALMRSLTIVGLLFAVLSLGPRLNWFTKEYDVPLLYAAVQHLPIFDSALPARLALVVVCVIGVVLALLSERVLRSSPGRRRDRVLWSVAFAVALVPIFPTPVLTSERSPEPKFIADGAWKRFVSDGQVMSALPYGASSAPDAQRWQAYTMARGGELFRIPDGYFLGPGGPNGTGRVGALPRRTDWMFLRAATTGYLDDIDNFDRARVREDLVYWDIHALFIPDEITGRDGVLFRAALVRTMTELFGPGERVDDVLVWRVRPGVDPMSVPGDGADNYGS